MRSSRWRRRSTGPSTARRHPSWASPPPSSTSSQSRCSSRPASLRPTSPKPRERGDRLMIITFGAIAVFFAIIIAILHFSGIKDRDFSEYAVGGRSFGALLPGDVVPQHLVSRRHVHRLRRHGGERRRYLVLCPVLQPAHRRSDVHDGQAGVDLGQNLRPQDTAGPAGASFQLAAHQDHRRSRGHHLGHSMARARHAGTRHAVPAHFARHTLLC